MAFLPHEKAHVADDMLFRRDVSIGHHKDVTMLEEGKGRKRVKGDDEQGSISGVANMFRFFSASGTRSRHAVRGIPKSGIIHPSDGHPQEELTPDFGLFRPLAFNNTTWTLYWPDLIV